MGENIVSLILGLVCILVGSSNRKGNISMLHSYHRKRVAEEDRLPLGKKVGMGMYLVGAGLILYGGLLVAAELLQMPVLETVATVAMAVGMASGLGLCLFAINKYNKGLF